MVGISGGTGVTIGYIVRGILLLAHLIGLVLAIILVVRKKGLAAILAAVAFALLFLLDGGILVRMATGAALIRAVDNPSTYRWIGTGLDCCCGMLDLIAVICLIIAIFKGIGAKAAGSVAEEGAEEGALAPTE
jgi:hypothetical protein